MKKLKEERYIYLLKQHYKRITIYSQDSRFPTENSNLNTNLFDITFKFYFAYDVSIPDAMIELKPL